MPVWVVAQPYREDLMLRAVLRIVGTVFGAAIGWFTLTCSADPVVSILVLVGSVGAGAAATFWIGTVYSYGVLLATITVAVVLIPALDHSVDTTQLAADRIWCTLIGVVVVTVITFAFTPRRPEPRPERVAPPPWVTLRHGAIAAGASLLGVGLLKVIAGPAGISAAMALSIFSTLIAGSRNPAPILRNMPVGATIGVATALAYRMLDMILPDPGHHGGSAGCAVYRHRRGAAQPSAQRRDRAGRKHVFSARRRGRSRGAWVQRASPGRHSAGVERGLVHGAVPPHRCGTVNCAWR